MGIVVLQAKRAEPVAEHVARHYHGIAERLALTDAIGDAFANSGSVTDAIVRDVAQRSSRSLKQSRRMIDEWLQVQAFGLPGKPQRLPDALLVKVAENNGSAAAAIRQFYPTLEEQQRKRSSVYRWLEEADVGTLLALKGGVKAWERLLEVGVYEPQHRNEMWMTDEMHIPIRCRGPRGEVIDNLHLISIFEPFARLVLNAQVTVGPSDAVIASAVLARAVAGGEWEGVAYGGSAGAMAMDNGLIFKSDLLRDVLLLARIPPKFARPYTPTDKAMIERWHGSLQQKWMVSFPAYLDGPPRRIFRETGELGQDGKPKWERAEVPLHVPVDPADLPSLEDITHGTYAAITDYNLNHVHSVTGQTAIVRYGSDPTLLARPGVAALWAVALPTGKPVYFGERRGIHVDGEWRRAAGESLIGRHLVARILPGLDPIYLVGTPDGRFIAEVKPSADETAEEAVARLDRNHARLDRLRQTTVIAQANVLARAAAPGTPAYVSDGRAAKLDAQIEYPLASLDAAMDVPDRPSAA